MRSIGGVLGFYTFGWLEDHGFYGLAIPGAFLGLGCGLLAQHRSIAARDRSAASRRSACRSSPSGNSIRFLVDNSFSFMVSHLIGQESRDPADDRPSATIIAFWVGQDAGFRLAALEAFAAGRPARKSTRTGRRRSDRRPVASLRAGPA